MKSPAFKNINTQKRKQKSWKINTIVKQLNEKEAGNAKVSHDAMAGSFCLTLMFFHIMLTLLVVYVYYILF